MPCNWHGSGPIKVTAASEACTRAERGMGESPRLREYTALFSVVSVLCERFDQHIRTRSGQACADQAKAFIQRAIQQRHHGDMDQAVECLHGAVISIQKGDVMEETFGPRLDQLWHGYDAVAQGVEPGSEAHEYLERFVVAVDLFNDATVQDDTDYIVERFDIALDWLKRAALARHRR
jgi:hypothetical protein